MQEQAINRDSVGKALKEVFQVESEVPVDFADLLGALDKVEYCREVALEISEQRLRRLLGNTANQTLS